MQPYIENRNQEIGFFSFSTTNIPDHLHTQFELLLPLEGNYPVSVDGKEYTLNANQTLLVFPNHIHSYVKKGKSKGVLFIFPSSILPDMNVNFQKNCPICPIIDDKDNEHIAYIKNYFVQKNGDFSEVHPLTLQALITLLLSSLLQNTTLVTPSVSFSNDIIYQAISYISANMDTDISLKKVASKIGTNACYLSSLINSYLHMSFRQYVNTLRIDKAKKMLLSSSDTIEEVGEKCGFNTLRTFDRAFVAETKKTPRQFRKDYKIEGA